MIYTRYSPADTIKDMVLFFWEFEGTFSKTMPFEHLASASVSPKLAFQYEGRMTLKYASNEEQVFRSGFQAQANSFYQIVSQEKVGVFGVYFHPHITTLLFGVPADVLTNTNIEIGELLGNEGKELEEQIILSKSTQERIKLISDFILSKKNHIQQDARYFALAAQQIVVCKGQIDVLSLSADYCLSQRQFERKFKELTGFSPKMFSRIVRFEECIRKAVIEKQSMTTVAVELGYYDQSHMIRDFREFSGQNPKSYFAEDISLYIEA